MHTTLKFHRCNHLVSSITLSKSEVARGKRAKRTRGFLSELVLGINSLFCLLISKAVPSLDQSSGKGGWTKHTQSRGRGGKQLTPMMVEHTNFSGIRSDYYTSWCRGRSCTILPNIACSDMQCRFHCTSATIASTSTFTATPKCFGSCL